MAAVDPAVAIHNAALHAREIVANVKLARNYVFAQLVSVVAGMVSHLVAYELRFYVQWGAISLNAAITVMLLCVLCWTAVHAAAPPHAPAAAPAAYLVVLGVAVAAPAQP